MLRDKGAAKSPRARARRKGIAEALIHLLGGVCCAAISQHEHSARCASGNANRHGTVAAAGGPTIGETVKRLGKVQSPHRFQIRAKLCNELNLTVIMGAEQRATVISMAVARYKFS